MLAKPEQAPVTVMGKLQNEVYRRRLHADETFDGFDPLHSGRCTSSQFQRALNRLSPKVSPEEGKTLADFFTEQDRPGPQVVNYRQFSRTLEEVFRPSAGKLPGPGTAESGSPQAAEQQPEGGGPHGARPASRGMPMSARCERDFRKGDVLPSARSARASTDLDDAGETGQQVLQKLRDIVKRRSLRLHGAFQDFDPLRRGVCSPTHLRTVLTVLNVALRPTEQDALLRLYRVHGWDRKDFDYRKFCDDINDLGLYSGAKPVDPWRPVSRGLDMLSSTQIFEKLCKQLRDQRCDAKGAFSDAFRQFDPRHRGAITPQQFGRIISMQGFSFTEAELKSLCSAFTDNAEGGPLVRCQEFLDALSTCMAIHFSGDGRPSSVRPEATSVARPPASQGTANGGAIAYPPTRCKSTAACVAARRRLRAAK